MRKKKILFKSFYQEYILKLSKILNSLNIDNIYKASDLIVKTIRKNNYIYVCGNGESAAITNH